MFSVRTCGAFQEAPTSSVLVPSDANNLRSTLYISTISRGEQNGALKSGTCVWKAPMMTVVVVALLDFPPGRSPSCGWRSGGKRSSGTTNFFLVVFDFGKAQRIAVPGVVDLIASCTSSVDKG